MIRVKRLNVQLIPDPEFGGFTARVPDIPAYGEGETEEAAEADLKEALIAYVEEFGLDDTLARVCVRTHFFLCGKAARAVLSGGCLVRGIPTGTSP